MDIIRPEVLAPAGDAERLKAAVYYGADAVYMGGTRFGMRAAPKNFLMTSCQKPWRSPMKTASRSTLPAILSRIPPN